MMDSLQERLADLTIDERTLTECCLCTAQIRDPVQLDCLHDCCKTCAEQQLATKAAAVDGANATASAAAIAHNNDVNFALSSGVTCRICHETTPDARVLPDFFLNGHIRLLSILSNRPLCDFCPAGNATAKANGAPMALEEAESFCRNCKKLLCAECFREHRRVNGAHVLCSLEQCLETPELSDSCFPPCPRHGGNLENACLSCMLPQCGACASECMARRHDVQVLHCTDVKNCIERLKRDVDSLDPLLVRIARHYQRQKRLTDDLSDARKSGKELLFNNKKAVLDAVKRAHRKAECALFEGCDELKREVDEEMAVATRLQESTARARLVGQRVINSRHRAAALSKSRPISERCQQLTMKLQRIDPQDERKRSVRYIEIHGGRLPDEEELNEIMETLIGLPALVRGTNEAEYAPERNNGTARSERDSDVRHQVQKQEQQDDKLQQQQQQAAREPTPASYEQPAFSISPSTSNSDSCGRGLSAPTPSLVKGSESVVQTTLLSVTEPLAGQSERANNCRHRMTRQRKPFVLKCVDCGSLVTESANLRLLQAQSAEHKHKVIQHHVVTDMEFPKRVRLHRHWKPSFIGTTTDRGFALSKEYKLSCKKCSNDWGVCVKIQRKYFYVIKIDTLNVICEGVQEKVKRWNDLPYTLKFISDSQLLTFGHDSISDDYPVPSRWYYEPYQI